MILVGDIGGTKTLLAVFENGTCLFKKQFSSAAYSTFQDLLTEFLALIPNTKIEKVRVGVAGAIVKGDCKTTNLPWNLVCAEIGQQVACKNVKLLNDLEAAAWGVLALPDSQFIELNPNAQKQTGNCAVLAAGTGLGEAIIFHDGEQQHHVIATEGGHGDFAPTDEQQIQLLSFMQHRFPEHVSYERLVSGVGIEAIYDFLKSSGNYADSDFVESTEDNAAKIGETALHGSNQLCIDTLQLFAKIYGAEAGNLALKCLPYGGVYLTGGIAAKCLPALQTGHFLESFLAKGRFRATLEKMLVRVCLESEVVLFGALHHAEKITS